MKILTDLRAGVVTEADAVVVSGIQHVLDQPVSGVMRKVTLSAEGLTVQRRLAAGQVQVRVPLAELMALADRAEPSLRVGLDAPTQAEPAAVVES